MKLPLGNINVDEITKRVEAAETTMTKMNENLDKVVLLLQDILDELRTP